MAGTVIPVRTRPRPLRRAGPGAVLSHLTRVTDPTQIGIKYLTASFCDFAG